MRRALLCSTLAALCGCASAPAAPSQAAPGSQLIEPTEHLPDPHHADVPRDIKHLGAMVPRWTLSHQGRAALSPTSVLQLSDAQGELRSLSTKNGAVQWRTSVQPLPGSRPVWHAGHVLVATASGLVAYAEASGQRVWTWPGRVEDLLVTDEALFMLGLPQGSNGQLMQLDVRSGKPQWSRPCLATCELVHAEGAALLLAPVQGRLLRIEGGRITRTLAGLSGVRSSALLGPDLLVATATAVARVAQGPGGWSLPQPGIRAARAVGPHLLVDRGDALLSLDRGDGQLLWTTTLSPALQGKLRLNRAVHLPEGQLLVPTEDLFGAAPVYLLIRDDGTLRVLRYGLPGLQDILTSQENVLYAGRSKLVYSGTRRRGAPVRHYQTLEQDVANQLAVLSKPAADAAERRHQRRALLWLGRLGRSAHAQALHAQIAGAPPSALHGLLRGLDLEQPEDRSVLLQAAWRLSVGPASLEAEMARRGALQALPEPWPEPFWAQVLAAAPSWLRALPRAGLITYTPGQETLRGLPADSGARSQAHALHGLATLQEVAERALAQGDAVKLWRDLAPSLGAQRRKLPCPWPVELLGGEHPALARCPLVAPPPGALLSDSAEAAAWRSGAAGHPNDVWFMHRSGTTWGPARFSGVQSPSLERGVFGALPTARGMAKDRDGDGLSDLLEARWGTDPRRTDTDRDGLSDDTDPSPSCATPKADDIPEQLRTALAQTVAALQSRPTVWRDGSTKCLSATLLAGPLVRTKAQPALPGQSVLHVDLLDPEAAAKALRTARASGQLRTPTSTPTLVLRYGITHGPLDGEGATVVFAQEGAQWRAVAWVDRWQS